MNLKLIIGVTVLITLSFVFYGVIIDQKKSKNKYKSEFINKSIKSSVFSREKIFEIKYTYYKESLKSFKNIQVGIISIIIISLLLLIFETKKITIPLISLKIPNGIVFLLIYFGGIYLWVNFGLTFNSIIDERMYLHLLLEKMEPNGTNFKASIQHVLADSSLIDNWFSHFFDIFKNEEKEEPFKSLNGVIGVLGLYCIYAYILGLFLSCIIVSCIEFIDKKKIHSVVSILMILFIFLMLMTSSMIFGQKMMYANLWLGIIWVWSLVGMITWYFQRDKLKELNEKVGS